MREQEFSGAAVSNRRIELRIQEFEREALAHLDTLLRSASRIVLHSQDALRRRL